MKTLTAIGAALWLGACAASQPAVAATTDGMAPLLCAPAIILECGADGTCARTTHEVANLPPFVKVNPKGNVISTMDESRTSPIKHLDRLKDRIILHGGEGARTWTAVISEATGKMSATAASDEDIFVIFGACTLFPGDAQGAGGPGK